MAGLCEVPVIRKDHFSAADHLTPFGLRAAARQTRGGFGQKTLHVLANEPDNQTTISEVVESLVGSNAPIRTIIAAEVRLEEFAEASPILATAINNNGDTVIGLHPTAAAELQEQHFSPKLTRKEKKQIVSLLPETPSRIQTLRDAVRGIYYFPNIVSDTSLYK